MNPLLLGILGPQAFGTWKSCLRIVDLTTVADGRASQALKSVVANKAGTQEVATTRSDLTAGVAVWVLSLPILSILGLLAVFNIDTLITGLSPSEEATAKAVTAILFANFGLAGILSIPDSALVGSNRGYISMNQRTFWFAITNGAMALAAILGGDIALLAILTLAGSLATALSTLLRARRAISWWGFSRTSWSRVRILAGLSGWTVSWEIVNRLLLSADILLVGALIGPASVAPLVFMTFAPQLGLSILLMTVNSLTPQLGNAIGRGDRLLIASLIFDARRLSFAMTIALGSILLAVNPTFTAVWGGNESFLGLPINLLVTASFLQVALLRVDSQLQDATLQLRLKTILGSLSTLASIALALLLFKLTGELWSILAGLLVGRLPMSFGLPIILKRSTSSDRSVNLWRRGTVLLAGSVGIGYGLQLVPTWASIAISPAVIIAIASVAATYIYGLPVRHRLALPRRGR